MKKPFLPTNLFTPQKWLAFHGVLLAAFVLSLFFARPLQFNTSLFDILPPSHALKNVSQADAALSARTGRAITILAYAEDFAVAKDAAAELYHSFAKADGQIGSPDEAHTFFDELALYVDEAATRELTDFLYAHRSHLLDAETIALLENGGAEAVAQDALARVYGAFSLTDLSLTEQDPFDLTGAILTRFLGAAQNGGSMSVKDDVLAAQKDGIWYVLLRGTLTADALSLTGKKSAVKEIYQQCQTLTGATGVQFAFSGVPFHSYESASAAQRQVSIISAIGMVLIVLLFLYMFRSLIPALVSAGAVALSCGVGLVAVLLFFRQIHILTFVFGTTLIGTCVDYAIHFFVHWKGDAQVANGADIRRKILRGIGISFASTEICFAALFLAPFPFLKQVAVFLFCGLLCAFLTVVCLLPLIPVPSAEKRTIALFEKTWWLRIVEPTPRNRFFHRVISAGLPIALFVGAITLLAVNHSSVKIENNLRDMYTMSARLLESEKTTARVLDYGSAGWYFLVEGESAEAVLQTEESFAQHLAAAQVDGKLQSYLATSSFIPSRARQEQSYAASSQLLPLVSAQYDALGFGAETSELIDNFYTDYKTSAEDFVSPQNAQDVSLLQSVTKNLWLGELNGRFYSCILPLHTTDEAYFRALAKDIPHVHFVNKVADIGSELNALTAMMLKLLAGAFVLVIVILCFCYPPKTVARIASIPVLVALVTVAVLSACKIPLGFFSVTGLVLVFGLGLDYIIYAVEGEQSDGALNNLAILISFVTTALSFGALALISFAPVHTIGLTVFAGLTTACVSAFAKALKDI